MHQKNQFFEGCSRFKFNNLELTLVMALKFYRSVLKGLNYQSENFGGLIPMFVGVTAEKLVGGSFFRGLNLFKTFIKVRYTLSGKILSAKSFRWGRFLSPSQYFVTFTRRKVFPQIKWIYYTLFNVLLN